MFQGAPFSFREILFESKQKVREFLALKSLLISQNVSKVFPNAQKPRLKVYTTKKMNGNSFTSKKFAKQIFLKLQSSF